MNRPVLSLRCSSYSSVNESSVLQVPGFQLKVQLRPDHPVTYELLRSYTDFVEFDKLIREKLSTQNLKFPLKSSYVSDSENSEIRDLTSLITNGPLISGVAEAAADYSTLDSLKETFDLTSYWLGFASMHPKQADTKEVDYSDLVEDFDFYLQDLLSRHEILASEEFALFFDPETSAYNQSQQNESNKDNRDQELNMSIHQYILKDSECINCIITGSEKRAYEVTANEIVLWKFLGCKSEFIVELNGIRKMSYITFKSDTAPQYGAMIADQGGTCELTWTTDQSSILPRKLSLWTMIVSAGEYDIAELELKAILQQKKLFQQQRNLLQYAALHRAESLSGILYHRDDRSEIEMSVNEYLSLAEKEKQIEELADVIERTESTVRLLEDRILSIGGGSDTKNSMILPAMSPVDVSSNFECDTAECDTAACGSAECGTAQCGTAVCGTAQGPKAMEAGDSTPGTELNPFFSLTQNSDIAAIGVDVESPKNNKCARRSKGLEKGALRARHPSFPRSGLSSAEPRERKRTKLIKGEGSGTGSRVGKEGNDGEVIGETVIGTGTGVENGRSQYKMEIIGIQTMSRSRDSEGEIHSMDSELESAKYSQTSSTDSDTGGSLVSPSSSIAGSVLTSNGRSSDSNRKEVECVADCVEAVQSGVVDSMQSRKGSGEIRKEARSAVRSRVKAVGLSVCKQEGEEDAVERSNSQCESRSAQASKRSGCVTAPVDRSMQAGGEMSKLLSGLFDDLNEGRKSLMERAAKRDIEVTQSILDDISRLNCGRDKDKDKIKAEDRFLLGSKSPSKASPSVVLPLEYDLEYYTEEEDSNPPAYSPCSPLQIHPESRTVSSIEQPCVKRRGANTWHNDMNNSTQHTLVPQYAAQDIDMKSYDMAQLTTSPLSPEGRDRDQGQAPKRSRDRSADRISSIGWEKETR